MRLTFLPSTRAALGLIAAAAALVTATIPVAAADPGPAALAPIRVDAQVGNACLAVHAPRKQTTVRLTQKRDGSTIRTRTGPTDTQRRIVFCVSKLRIGDTLTIRQGDTRRSIRVPDLTVTPDQDDTIRGRVPTSNLTFQLGVYFGMGGAPSASYTYPDQTAGGDGTFSVDVSDYRAINGSDSASVAWASPKGDTWLVISPLTRAFRVEAGESGATIVDRVGRTVTLTLKDAGGTVRATATATLRDDTKKVTFRKNGDPVTVHVGDRVSTSSASSLEMEILDPGLILDPGPPGGYISFTCLEDSAWAATVTLEGAVVHRWGGTTDVGGEVSFVNVTGQDDDASGHLVVVDCESPTGFVQRFRGTFA